VPVRLRGGPLVHLRQWVLKTIGKGVLSAGTCACWSTSASGRGGFRVFRVEGSTRPRRTGRIGALYREALVAPSPGEYTSRIGGPIREAHAPGLCNGYCFGRGRTYIGTVYRTLTLSIIHFCVFPTNGSAHEE